MIHQSNDEMSQIEKVVSKEHVLDFVVEDGKNLRAKINPLTMKEDQSKNLVLHLKETSFNIPQCVAYQCDGNTSILVNCQPLIPKPEN